MKIGLLTFNLYIPWAQSLKEKRSVVKSLIDKLKSKFNISIIESGKQDKHQIAELSIATLGANHALCDSIIDNVLNFSIENCDAEIIIVDRELI